MQYKTLLFDIQEHVAYITINRPEAANSINLEFSKDLLGAILQCDEDPEIRAVVITGKGNLFCAGGDLKEFINQGPASLCTLKRLLPTFTLPSRG